MFNRELKMKKGKLKKNFSGLINKKFLLTKDAPFVFNNLYEMENRKKVKLTVKRKRKKSLKVKNLKNKQKPKKILSLKNKQKPKKMLDLRKNKKKHRRKNIFLRKLRFGTRYKYRKLTKRRLYKNFRLSKKKLKYKSRKETKIRVLGKILRRYGSIKQNKKLYRISRFKSKKIVLLRKRKFINITYNINCKSENIVKSVLESKFISVVLPAGKEQNLPKALLKTKGKRYLKKRTWKALKRAFQKSRGNQKLSNNQQWRNTMIIVLHTMMLQKIKINDLPNTTKFLDLFLKDDDFFKDAIRFLNKINKRIKQLTIKRLIQFLKFRYALYYYVKKINRFLKYRKKHENFLYGGINREFKLSNNTKGYFRRLERFRQGIKRKIKSKLRKKRILRRKFMVNLELNPMS